MILQSMDSIDWSLQSIFDHVAEHLLTQNKKSVDPKFKKTIIKDNPDCFYRLNDGSTGTMLACAIGCLIPDDLYDLAMERNNVFGLSHYGVLGKNFSLLENEFCRKLDELCNNNNMMDFLDRIQAIHDLNEPYSWSQKLSILAKDYNLNDSVITAKLL